MTNKHLTLTLILIAGLALSGCGSHAATAHRSATSSAASSTSESQKTPAKSASDQATMKPYQVPKSEKQNRDYRRSGLLTLPGQFAYDKVGTKLTLSQNVTQKHQTASNGIVYRVTDVKRYRNNAKTQRALSMAEQAFNVAKIPNPYQTIQIKFRVKNQSSRAIKIDGITHATINASRNIESDGLSDPSAGATIKAGQTRAFSAMILAGPTSFKVSQLQIKFSGGFNDAGQTVIAAPKAIGIQL
ncbi:hypothetical protein [Secundilactobacillus folii]|uniref:DUF4352 domain-containing protein n=1 Tax=Secundilactobacillus folii TaxID=2678357 RepID=A0A7X2XTK5_9LACO|nr:hypothetical protein [Secundilactobacillus folii]MTV81333.1 hypothetical protein [Secundilactobacillus folii]